MATKNVDPLETVPSTPSLRLRPLVALLFAWVGLVGVRTVAFSVWQGTGSLFALAMLDLAGLFLATIAFVVLPLSKSMNLSGLNQPLDAPNSVGFRRSLPARDSLCRSGPA